MGQPHSPAVARTTQGTRPGVEWAGRRSSVAPPAVGVAAVVAAPLPYCALSVAPPVQQRHLPAAGRLASVCDGPWARLVVTSYRRHRRPQPPCPSSDAWALSLFVSTF